MIFAPENISAQKSISSQLVFESTKPAKTMHSFSIGIFRLIRDVVFYPRKKGK